MTRYIADYASYQGALTVADLHRAEFDVVNFKTSHGTSTKSVHPRIKAEIASARNLGLGIGTFHWLIGNMSGTEQANYAFGRLSALGLTQGTMHTLDVEEQADADDELPPEWHHVLDYVTRMRTLLGRPVQIYTGDWYWKPRAWKGSAVSPHLMAAPNDGYMPDRRYPGADSEHWRAGYGGWPNLSTMQYAVDTLIYPGGGRSTTEVSKSAMRDESVWSALTGKAKR